MLGENAKESRNSYELMYLLFIQKNSFDKKFRLCVKCYQSEIGTVRQVRVTKVVRTLEMPDSVAWTKFCTIPSSDLKFSVFNVLKYFSLVKICRFIQNRWIFSISTKWNESKNIWPLFTFAFCLNSFCQSFIHSPHLYRRDLVTVSIHFVAHIYLFQLFLNFRQPANIQSASAINFRHSPISQCLCHSKLEKRNHCIELKRSTMRSRRW